MKLDDDFYGIGPAVQAAADVYFAAARRSGRSARLVESVRDGDAVVFLNKADQRRFERDLAESGRAPDVRLTVSGPGHMRVLYQWYLDLRPKPSRILFDHRFLQEWYQSEVERIRQQVAAMQVGCWSWGEACSQSRDEKACQLQREGTLLPISHYFKEGGWK